MSARHARQQPLESTPQRGAAHPPSSQAMDAAPPRALSSVLHPFGMLAALALVVVGWTPSFYEIWRSRWFPAWKAYDLSVWQRMTNGDSYYTHGPLVPLICLGIAYYIYRRVGLPSRPSAGAALAGWTLLIASVTLHMVGVYFRVKFLSGFCFVGAVGSLVLLSGGWPLARAYWVPVVFLTFMVPLPMSTIQGLNLNLKFMASEAGVWMTRHLFGVPAVLDGSFVYLRPDPSGEAKTLVVENVCGGLRSLIALLFFASLFAVVCRVKGVWRWLMLALAVPVAIACNIVRITALNLAAHWYGTRAAAEGAWFHDLSGVLVFMVALAILFGVEAIIIAGGKALKRDWTDVRLLPFLASIPRGGTPRRLAAPVLVLALAAGLSLYGARQPIEQNLSDTARHAIPQAITLDGQTFIGQDFELDQHTLILLETNDYLYRRYTSAAMPRGFEVLIVFSSHIRNGAHAPEVCLEGGGQHIVANRSRRYEVAGLPGALPGAGGLTMRELVTQRETELALHCYVFQCGQSYTTSYVIQQSTIFWSGITGGSTAGGLIRFTVPIYNRDEEGARRVLQQAVAELMPHLNETLK